MSRKKFVHILMSIAVLGMVCAPTVVGYAPHETGSLEKIVRAAPAIVPAYDEDEQTRLRSLHPEIAELRSRAGGAWHVSFDQQTGAVRRAIGKGIPLIPGDANDLKVAGYVTLDELEVVARQFITHHSGLFSGVDLNEWVLDRAGSQPLRDGLIRPIRFTRRSNGVDVEWSQIQLVLNRGSLTYINVTGLQSQFPDAVATLSEQETWAHFVAVVDGAELTVAGAEPVGKATLGFAQTQESPGGTIGYRLVRRHEFTLPGGFETWRASVDAHTGELFELIDTNSYMCSLDPTKLLGVVRGGVRPAQATDAEEIRNFIFPRIDDDGVTIDAGYEGQFFYSGKTASCDLQGTYFSNDCTGCTPNPPFVTTSSTGILDFGFGGTNQISNGLSTPADRASHYHLNAAVALARKWINRPWLDRNIGNVVNIANTCNAFYNGQMNFFRSGGGCANTGEIRDVMQHEWGHGMDANDGVSPQDSAMGEAYGDMIALFIDHDSCIGQSFFGNSSGPYCITNPDCTNTATCTGVRNIDEKRATRGLMTMTTALTKCAPAGCAGPLGRECHCEGEVYGQASFHLAYNLLTGNAYDTGNPLAAGNPAFGDRAAWYLHERTFFNATALMASYAPSNRQTRGTGTYDAYTIVDDDDADLTNGVPLGAYFDDAFIHHEMQEPTVIGDSVNCLAPSDPPITTTPLYDPTTGAAQVEIGWNDVAGAQFYDVLKNTFLGDAWLPVASQVAAGAGPYTIFDQPIIVGEEYNYVVIAVGPDGCPSAGDNVQTQIVALPDAAVSLASATDPAPGGDGDGVVEPGELILLQFDLSEIGGLIGMNQVMVELWTTDPLATVTVPGPIDYGNIPASGTVPGPSMFEIGISTAHGCGTKVPLIVAVTAENACLMKAFALDIPTAACAPGPRGEAVPTAIRITNDSLDPTCTDNDGFPDNGETVEVTVDISNPGTLAANNVTVTLSSNNPNVVVNAPNPVNIASLAASGTDVAVFTVKASNAGCQETAELVATVDSDDNLFPVAGNGTTILEEDRVSVTISADFETDLGGWTANGWTRSNSRQNAGQWSVYAGPGAGHACDNSGDGANACSTLTSQPFVAGPITQLNLFNWYAIEDFGGSWWDRANVHVIDSSGTHTVINPITRAYDGGAGDTASPLCHIIGEDGWAGSTSGNSWATALFDLFAWNGEEIQVEINYNSDGAAICEGIYVDDIQITGVFNRQCDALVCGSSAPDVVIDGCTNSDVCPSSGSGDGVIDPGDQITYQVSLRNVGSAAAIDVQGNIQVTGGTIVSGGTIGGAPQLDIPVGDAFIHTVVIDVTGACGDTLDVDIVNLTAGTDVFPSNLTACDLTIGANQPAQVATLEDVPVPAVAIPDAIKSGPPNRPLTRNITMNIPSVINSATLFIEVTHGRVADLSAWLVGPLGTQVGVDAAINGSVDVSAVLADGVGDYTLVLYDGVSGERGVLDRWALDIDHEAFSSCTVCSGSCTAPAVSVTPNDPMVCADGTVSFTTNFTNPGTGAFDYEWDFGDGSPAQVVTDPFAPVSHRFDGLMPSYTVTFRALSRSQSTCDTVGTTNISIDTGTAPSGGPVGNVLRGFRMMRGASFLWPGSSVNPKRFAVHKAFAKEELVDTPTGIGDELVLVVTPFESLFDGGALDVLPSLMFYEVHPAGSCGDTVVP